MTDIALTAAQIAPVFPAQAEIYDAVAAATIATGQALYRNTAGKVAPADANAGSGAEVFVGIALNGGGAGQAISVLKRGHVYGFTVSGLAYGAHAYLSDTAGALADAASATNIIPVGTIQALSDANLTKVLYVDAEWGRPAEPYQSSGIFVSAEATGTGNPQNVAHTLGVAPRLVLVAPTEHPGTPDTGAFDIAEGTHTSTNVVVTVTLNVKFKVLAFA